MSRKASLACALVGVAAIFACDRGAEPRVDPAGSSPADADASAAPTGGGEDSAGGEAAWQRFDFESDTVGSGPSGFTAVHSGGGEPGDWRVVDAPGAPSGRQAVAQLDPDRTGSRFPLLVLDSVVCRDVELEVQGKPITGSKDQAIGLIWRFQDADNYYILRANALEDNVVLYKMEAGKRSDLDLLGRGRTYGLDVEVPREAWSRLGVTVRGNRFTAFLDGRELFQVEDGTFAGPGKVGLWTKADSVTWFDDLAVRILDPSESEPEPANGN